VQGTSRRSLNSFGTLSTFSAAGREFHFYDLRKLEKAGVGHVSGLPYSLKILLENLLRQEDGISVTAKDIETLAGWDPANPPRREIAFTPARVLLQDFTGVPALVDLAAMRNAVADMGGDPGRINPLVPVELVIDHSVQVDSFGSPQSFALNAEIDFQRNLERYAFLRWGQSAFAGFQVVPPATGIVHQVNLEYLARVVFDEQLGDRWTAYPDTLVGTDSHTTMVNGLGVLGWGVGGIEAEAAMLGQPISMLIPEVIGFRLTGALKEGVTATDLVLTITQMLRKKGVVGKFVEFFGSGVQQLTLADRATIGNMSPEYGATCAIFPVDRETLSYLDFTARPRERLELVEAYTKEQGLFYTAETPDARYQDSLELDLSTVEASLAGPKRPQDRIPLRESGEAFKQALKAMLSDTRDRKPKQETVGRWEGEGGGSSAAAVETPSAAMVSLQATDSGVAEEFELGDGAVVVAAITSCTNTSNPSVMLGAGLLAKKAVERGLRRRPWVKTSLAPGSKVVTEYLNAAGLTPYLDQLGFHLVGYGCTTCIGNSGPLPKPISDVIEENDLVVCAVLSGNRNFEGRINPHVRANYLASPPLVVAYALAGRMDVDLYKEPLGLDQQGREVFLKDIWPSEQEIRATIQNAVKKEMFAEKYADVYAGDARWQALPILTGRRYEWNEESTYVRNPPFFQTMPPEPEPLEDFKGLRVLAVLGDSVTTDHISPAGTIPEKSPAGRYLMDRGVMPKDFNSYGARRGNHEVMMRGTFANIRLRNLMVPGVQGGYTIHPSSSEPTTIYEAAMRYQQEGVPLIILAGREYGSGSSRDWAAKGPRLLGVQVVLAESYERIHRSNLIGMGILPLQFEAGQSSQSLGLTASEVFEVTGLRGGITPGQKVNVRAVSPDGSEKRFSAVARIDTPNEAIYYRHGGILEYMLRSMMG
jgi:aconitate hydratase